MDLGDLFLLTNYHHVMGERVDLEGIIRRNLSTTSIPSQTINTREVFERNLAHDDEQINKHCPSTSDNQDTPAEIKPNLNPDQNKHLNTTKTNNPFNRQLENIVSSNNVSKKDTLTEGEKRSSYIHVGEPSESVKDDNNDKSAVASTLTEELNKSFLVDQAEIIGVEQTTTKEYSCKKRFHSNVVSEIQHSSMEKYPKLGSSDFEYSEQEKRTYETIIDCLVKAQQCFLNTPVDKYDTSEHRNQKSSHRSTQFEEISDEVTKKDKHALKQILQFIQIIITAIVKFSRHIPGFSDLSINARLILMKASKTETHLLGSVLMDTQTKSLQVTNDRRMTFEELRQFFDKDYLEQSFKCTDELNTLHLSEREMAVIRAKIIIYPDREGLEDKDAVKKLYQQINDCLLYVLIQDKCSTIPNRLFQIDDSLNSLRELTFTYNHVLENVFEESRMMNNFGLIKEFMDM